MRPENAFGSKVSDTFYVLGSKEGLTRRERVLLAVAALVAVLALALRLWPAPASQVPQGASRLVAVPEAETQNFTPVQHPASSSPLPSVTASSVPTRLAAPSAAPIAPTSMPPGRGVPSAPAPSLAELAAQVSLLQRRLASLAEVQTQLADAREELRRTAGGLFVAPTGTDPVLAFLSGMTRLAREAGLSVITWQIATYPPAPPFAPLGLELQAFASSQALARWLDALAHQPYQVRVVRLRADREWTRLRLSATLVVIVAE